MPTTLPIPKTYLSAYSRCEMTRREIAAAMGVPIGFGDLLVQLSESGFPLPRVPSNPDNVELVRRLSLQAGGMSDRGIRR